MIVGMRRWPLSIITVIVLVLLCLALFPAGPAPAHAGAQKWSAWIYEVEKGRLNLLTDVMNSKPEQLALPLRTGFLRHSSNVAISADWRFISYVAAAPEAARYELVIYDRNARNIHHVVPLPAQTSNSLEFVGSELVYDETNSFLAFGASFEGPAWDVRIVNLASRAVGPVLRHSDALVTRLGIPANFGLTPIVRSFRGGVVIFTMVQTGTEGSPQYDSFAWDTRANTVAPVISYPTLGGDTLVTTGETLSEVQDNRFANCGEPCSPFFVPNVISAYNPAAGQRFPFYTSRDAALFRPTFIQNGERILLAAYGKDSRTTWTVLERNGQRVGNLRDGMNIGSVIGWQDGMLYIIDGVNPTGASRLVVVNTRNGVNDGTVIWTGEPGSYPRLIQTPGNMQPAALLPPIAVLNAPAAAISGNCPGFLPSRLVPGQNARVTPGDPNRIRNTPGGPNVLGTMPGGSQFLVLAGPSCASNGIAWWKIYWNGIMGWTGEGQANTYWTEPIR